ncbi:MAG: lycopene cyclase family protein, partial [Bacteroidota bacterium]
MNRNGARFDFVFLGLGAANSLILRSLDAQGLLRGRRFAVFEPDAKRANDRTFCFWAEPDEVEALGLLPLVSHAWDTVRIGGISETSILPMRYWHIRGIDLYEQTRALLARYPDEALILAEPWEAYAASTAAGFVFPFGETRIVFDSRPPQFQQAAAHEAHLLQSFLGWEIECPAGTFDTSAVVMMDFRIPQEQHTQFVYILPFSDTNALVEVTRFGTVPVQENEAAELLADYLANNFPEYHKLHLERGVIPMSSVPLRETAAGPGWIFTGSRADRVNPSTGYAFHAMARDAQQVAKAIAAEQAVRLPQRRPRFVFYDRLLLKILEQRPQLGKTIFQTLFRRSALPDVLHFLSEKTRFAQDLNILRRLPFLLFFSFALRDIFQRLKTQRLWPLPLAATLLLLACNSLGLDAVSWTLIGAGLLLIGIPHGALDHLAHLQPLRPGPLLGFVALYLAAIALCAVVWIWDADLALLF